VIANNDIRLFFGEMLLTGYNPAYAGKDKKHLHPQSKDFKHNNRPFRLFPKNGNPDRDPEQNQGHRKYQNSPQCKDAAQ
jgi:hypothetical protein